MAEMSTFKSLSSPVHIAIELPLIAISNIDILFDFRIGLLPFHQLKRPHLNRRHVQNASPITSIARGDEGRGHLVREFRNLSQCLIDKLTNRVNDPSIRRYWSSSSGDAPLDVLHSCDAARSSHVSIKRLEAL